MLALIFLSGCRSSNSFKDYEYMTNTCKQESPSCTLFYDSYESAFNGFEGGLDESGIFWMTSFMGSKAMSREEGKSSQSGMSGQMAKRSKPIRLLFYDRNTDFNDEEIFEHEYSEVMVDEIMFFGLDGITFCFYETEIYTKTRRFMIVKVWDCTFRSNRNWPLNWISDFFQEGEIWAEYEPQYDWKEQETLEIRLRKYTAETKQEARKMLNDLKRKRGELQAHPQ